MRSTLSIDGFTNAKECIGFIRAAGFGYVLNQGALVGARITNGGGTATFGKIHHLRAGFTIRLNFSALPLIDIQKLREAMVQRNAIAYAARDR